MKRKFLPFLLVTVVLASSIVVSIARFPVASAIKSGWHTAEVDLTVSEAASYASIVVKETKNYEIRRRELTIHTDPNITLTMIVKLPTTNDTQKRVELVSFTFQQGDLCFMGWQGTVASLENDGTILTMRAVEKDFQGLDIYDLSGSGKGSYGPQSRFDNAHVEGSIHINDFWMNQIEDSWIDWVELTLHATIKYFEP